MRSGGHGLESGIRSSTLHRARAFSEYIDNDIIADASAGPGPRALLVMGG